MRIAALSVKNEADGVEACIRAAAPAVDAFVVVLDTSSTDATSDILRALDAGKPITVIPAPWPGDWAAAYNRAIALAFDAGASTAWLLDADEKLEIGTIEQSTADAQFHCRLYGGDWEVWMPRIIHNPRARFVGKRHATLAPEFSCRTKSNVVVAERRAPGSSAHDPARFLRDVGHFQRLLGQDPSDARSAYYLAQSRHDARQGELALVAYERRAAMQGGNVEERYIAALQVARYQRILRWPPDAISESFARARRLRPHRAEAWTESAAWHNDRREYETALMCASAAVGTLPSNDLFLVQRSARTWRAARELARAHEGLGEKASAARAWERMLAHPDTPEPERLYAQQRIRLNSEDPRCSSPDWQPRDRATPAEV